MFRVVNSGRLPAVRAWRAPRRHGGPPCSQLLFLATLLRPFLPAGTAAIQSCCLSSPCFTYAFLNVALRRHPVDGVARPDPVRPLRQPASCQLAQARRYVEAVGLYLQAALGTPGRVSYPACTSRRASPRCLLSAFFLTRASSLALLPAPGRVSSREFGNCF